jgi:DMSO reductase anchor subunit
LVANNGEVKLSDYISISIGFALIAGILKAIYYFWISNPGATSTINTATGFTRGTVRLLDTGHTHGTFLTEEFGFKIQRKYTAMLKFIVFAVGFVLPVVILVAGEVSRSEIYAASILAVMGVIAERWLFFAEARHVINLYHGAQAT